MAKDWKEFERVVAKSLGAWFGCTFRRTPGSGAWGKQGQSRFSKASDATRDFHGDIVAPPDARFPFSVECKTYACVELYQCLYGKSPVYDWWKQCEDDAKSVGKLPLLVFKENRKQTLVAIDERTFKLLNKFTDIKKARRISLTFHRSTVDHTLHMFQLQSFIENCDASVVKRIRLN